MRNPATHLSNIDIAFLQLSFALKLSEFVKETHFRREYFDREFQLRCQNQTITLSHGEFIDQVDFEAATSVHIVMSYGVAASALWAGIESTGYKRPSEIRSEKDNLAELIYAIRNCFSHGPAEPRWHFKKNLADRVFKIESLSINLSNKNGEIFDYSDIGGATMIFLLRDLVGKHFFYGEAANPSLPVSESTES